MHAYFDISRFIWEHCYRWQEGALVHDATIEATWRRVASALASVECAYQDRWERRFYDVLKEFRFLPGGRILAGAGTRRQNTLFNCFVMGGLENSESGISDALEEIKVTLQAGGGTGVDFSTVHPQIHMPAGVESPVLTVIQLLKIVNGLSESVPVIGSRRGIITGALRCDHPDIEAFIEAKQHGRTLHHLHLSVLITDAFMQAVNSDLDWPLIFPVASHELKAEEDEIIYRQWPCYLDPVPCRVYRRVSARGIWKKVIDANYRCAEPSLIFIDRIQQSNNLRYCERVYTTDPCGEVPLPYYGACNLGSINLARCILRPFTVTAAVDWDGLERVVDIAVRMLDNVYDISPFPLSCQHEIATQSRRIGLGVTGMADALVMLGMFYSTAEAIELVGKVMERIRDAAYRMSIRLAVERGAFPAFSAGDYLKSEFAKTLPKDIILNISKYGIRNSHLIAIAPARTISLLAGNISRGIEPIRAAEYEHEVWESGDEKKRVWLTDYAVAEYRRINGSSSAIPPAFMAASEVEPEAQLAMQAFLQKYVDNAISKTVTISENFELSELKSVFERAYWLGLKGCTVFR